MGFGYYETLKYWYLLVYDPSFVANENAPMLNKWWHEATGATKLKVLNGG